MPPFVPTPHYHFQSPSVRKLSVQKFIVNFAKTYNVVNKYRLNSLFNLGSKPALAVSYNRGKRDSLFQSKNRLKALFKCLCLELCGCENGSFFKICIAGGLQELHSHHINNFFPNFFVSLSVLVPNDVPEIDLPCILDINIFGIMVRKPCSRHKTIKNETAPNNQSSQIISRKLAKML